MWAFSSFGKGYTIARDFLLFAKPGFYGYHCLPHRGLGMVGLIIVEGAGMRDNLSAVKAVKHVGEVAEKWRLLWAKAQALI